MTISCSYTIEGQGPAVFLIHGIGARRTGFAKIAEQLKTQFTCISYDLRGHGESPLPEGRFGLDDLVDDLEELRAKLGIEVAHFAGHSLGGMIAPAYARRFPGRVLSIGLLSTAAFRTEDDKAKIKVLGDSLRELGIGNVLDTMTARWFTDAFRAAHPEIIARRARQVLDTDPDVFLNVFEIYAGTEMAPWLHEVTAPALVLTGELDGGCSPRLNRLIADALPNSELVVLDSLKHAITLEAPDRVAAVMQRFMSAHSESPNARKCACTR
jgi:pimeloyl-ACP methyl ester carboxylesterase